MSTLENLIVQRRPIDVAPARSFGEMAGATVAWSALAGVDLLIKLGGFQRFHRALRSWPVRKRRQEDVEVVSNTCTAVDRAATYYFKRAWCLQRSATAVLLLRWRGVNAQLVIGVEKMPFYAHAWTEVDGQVVNDHPSIQKRYTVLERC